MLLRYIFILFAKYPDRGWLLMQTQYEIFRNACQGDAVKITTVETPGKAEQTLHALAWLEPGDYFTRACATGEIITGRNNLQSPAGS